MNLLSASLRIFPFAIGLLGGMVPKLMHAQSNAPGEATSSSSVGASGGLASDSNASAMDVSKPIYYLCKLGRQVRTLRVSIKEGRCHAYYTKQGVEQVVGDSNVNSTCHEVASKIKKNLEIGDWKCRDISSSKMSFIEE